MGSFKRLFAEGSSRYAQFRPLYPPELYQRILEHHSGERELAVDVATGTGQASKQLAKTFERVVAVDSSPEQIAKAEPVSNVDFRVATAERLLEEASLDENSADVITVAQALHWFEAKQFYDQCRRLLKPNGCLAAWCYGLWSHPNNPEADAAVVEISQAVGDYWAPPIRHIEERYGRLLPGEDVFVESEFFAIPAKATMNLHKLTGLISTWSAYKAFKASNKEAEDPIITFREKSAAALGLRDDEEEFEVQWDFFGFLARNPMKANHFPN